MVAAREDVCWPRLRGKDNKVKKVHDLPPAVRPINEGKGGKETNPITDVRGRGSYSEREYKYSVIIILLIINSSQHGPRNHHRRIHSRKHAPKE